MIVHADLPVAAGCRSTRPGAPSSLPGARMAMALLVALGLLTGCATGPRYVMPAIAVPDQYRQAPRDPMTPADGGRPAQADVAARGGAWWWVFNDPVLDVYQARAGQASPTLQAALARLNQAGARQQEHRAGRVPQADMALGASRERPSAAGGDPPISLWRAGLEVSYEVDLFGRIDAEVSAADADAQQQAALYRTVLLALQADVAQTYLLVRELDAEVGLRHDAQVLRERAYRLAEQGHAVGARDELSVLRARTEYESARSAVTEAQRRRALAEHTLAALLGYAPAEFEVAVRPAPWPRVSIPAGLPSTLLERRPDIAAAERAMAAANARVGVAHAARFPRLSLTAAGGFESTALADLLQWSSRTFLLGPRAGGGLTLPLLDGGRRKAQLAHAHARYQEDVAHYRQTVLVAFREVEDTLVHLRTLADQQRAVDTARHAADRAAALARVQYDEGALGQGNAIEAERTALEHRLAVVRVEGEKARTTVQLIRALGGGWATPAPLAAASHRIEHPQY